MKFLAVKNFEKFQHYRDRNPPWIKLYGDILSDVAFLEMHEVAQAQLMKLWVLASQLGHPLPNNPRLLAGRIGVHGRFHIDTMIAAGFLIPCEQDASNLASESASTPLAEMLANPLAESNGNASPSVRVARTRARVRGESTELESKATTSRPRKQPRVESDEPRVTWLTPVCAEWESRNGAGSFAGIAGQAAKALAPLAKAGHTPAEIGEHFGAYLALTDQRFWSVSKFAQTFGQWAPQPITVDGVLTEYGERITRPDGFDG
jgi:hypothetical protein